jgi:hypothetical protein
MSDTRTYYAQVINDIVTVVHVVSYEFLVANPDRYGDPETYLQVYPDGSNRGYCGVGWIYDRTNDTFIEVPRPEVDQ